MFFWNSLAFSMIQRILAIWSLVLLPHTHWPHPDLDGGPRRLCILLLLRKFLWLDWDIPAWSVEVREPAFPHTREEARGRDTVGERAWASGTGPAGQLPASQNSPGRTGAPRPRPRPPSTASRMSFQGRGPEEGEEPGTVLRLDEGTQPAL